MCRVERYQKQQQEQTKHDEEKTLTCSLLLNSLASGPCMLACFSNSSTVIPINASGFLYPPWIKGNATWNASSSSIPRPFNHSVSSSTSNILIIISHTLLLYFRFLLRAVGSLLPYTTTRSLFYVLLLLCRLVCRSLFSQHANAHHFGTLLRRGLRFTLPPVLRL